MWMSNKNRGECPAESEPLAETQPTLRHAFKHVYGFILQAVKGDRTTADAIFEDYLLENYPKNCCQFRGVASVRIKQAHLTARLRRDGRRRDN
jgi:hypothetical protein